MMSMSVGRKDSTYSAGSMSSLHSRCTSAIARAVSCSAASGPASSCLSLISSCAAQP